MDLPSVGAGITVCTETMCDFFTKFHLEGLPFAAVLHRFTAADAGGGEFGDGHDHPFAFRSFILHGGYVERVFAADGSSRDLCRVPGDSIFVEATRIHRIVELLGDECWTLILPGPHEQTSGFWQFREDGPWRRDWNGEWMPVGQARAA